MDPDRLKNLKQARTAAKSKLTIVKKTVLNNLMSSRTPLLKIDSSEKDFQKAFAALNEAHSSYMAAMEDEGDDLDPKDVKYMKGPIEDQVEVGEAWAEWHMARDDVQRAEKDADEAKQRNEEREYAKGVEKQKRADDKQDAEDKVLFGGKVTRYLGKPR